MIYHITRKKIREYDPFNKKLMEITEQHKQVALVETDTDRKYHTRHDLHFNKLGKLMFSK